MHKKWIALLLAGLVICNLSACGNGNSDQNISQGNEYSSIGDQGNQNTQASDKTNSASGLTSLIHRTGLFNRYCSTEDGLLPDGGRFGTCGWQLCPSSDVYGLCHLSGGISLQR